VGQRKTRLSVIRQLLRPDVDRQSLRLRRGSVVDILARSCHPSGLLLQTLPHRARLTHSGSSTLSKLLLDRRIVHIQLAPVSACRYARDLLLRENAFGQRITLRICPLELSASSSVQKHSEPAQALPNFKKTGSVLQVYPLASGNELLVLTVNNTMTFSRTKEGSSDPSRGSKSALGHFAGD
jgi:hypothetical protein